METKIRMPGEMKTPKHQETTVTTIVILKMTRRTRFHSSGLRETVRDTEVAYSQNIDPSTTDIANITMDILNELCSPEVKRRKQTEDKPEDESFDTTFSNFSSQTESIPSSQISSWSENVEPSLDDVNEAIGILSNGKISPLKFQVTREIDSLQPSTKRLIKRKALVSVESLLNGIAPGQSQDLLKMIVPEAEKKDNNTLKQIIVKSYEDSDDRNTKRQLLSLIVDSNTKKELMQIIPTVTMYAIDEARKHAKQEGHGLQIPSQPVHFRQKMDNVKLDHALDFIFNPTFHQVSSFGTKEIKLDDGTIVTNSRSCQDSLSFHSDQHISEIL
ncbi:hypothetical protein FSP39_010112 [Pinctada imbricata]|uniref:Uncharacterized protein n=1 Tax=Pinctada imbricata TaxID=66713 RepID=A0AA89CBR3_PINIB|nr:hypothetical protein FSP39_010112 [Pinctada imbricata]